jgi:Lsr2
VKGSLMAHKTVVTVVCDLPHDGEVEGDETVSFAVDGTAYDIDVCSAHAKELHDVFGGYIEHARRVSGAARRRKARTGPGRERSSEIRQWARERDYKVSERGRIPASIIAEYEATH